MPGLLSPGNGQEAEDRISLISIKPVNPSPDTLTKLINRLRALTLIFLPVEVDHKSINEPTSRIITPKVVSVYRNAAGDFVDALPYCLLRARAAFIWDANHNPADYGENTGRAMACEVLARRIIHLTEPDNIKSVMSMRYKYRQMDGDESEMSNALELAIDQHCTVFISSNEAQEVVNALWNGDLIQKNTENNEIEYVQYSQTREHTFWGHFDPSRLSAPRYQNIFRISVWLFFLVVYSQAVREPLERLDDAHKGLDLWELALYVLSLSFIVEDFHKFFSLLRFVSWRAFSFWNVIAFITDSLLLAAFTLRMIGLGSSGDQEASMRLYSFQVLSCVSPFIWMKLVTVFDGFMYVGTMQICVARMLKESGIFFGLLSVLALGFGQALFALDAADGSTDPPSKVVNILVQSLLGAADFSNYAASPVGLILHYLWNAVTAIILLNVLISLFSSAYAEVIDDAEAQYLAFFAGKTIGMIRAPDSYVYPAPFNLIEAVFIAPFESVPLLRLSGVRYAQLNRYCMGILFFIPLTLIAFYESTLDKRRYVWMENWFTGEDEAPQDCPENRNPEVNDPNCEGLKISKVPFEELIKAFPKIDQSSEESILKEVRDVKNQLHALMEKLDKLHS